MIELLQPLLLAGAAAMSAPVLIHLWRRRQLKRIDWGAMRFLEEVMAQRRRRLVFEEMLLMALRALILGMIAFAMARPAFRRAPAAAVAPRQGGVAAVLLVDDSVSSSAGRAAPAIESMKRLGAAYLDSLAPGDEVSLLRLSDLGSPAADPEFDLAALKSTLAKIRPSHAATDIPALLDAGLDQLKRHINPTAELALLTDGRADGWRPGNRSRWDALRERLRGPNGALLGSRARPRVIVLAAEAEAPESNLAITGVAMDRTLVTAGKPAGVRVRVENFGRGPAPGVSVAIAINGHAAGETRVDLPPGGGIDAAFTHVFAEPGSYSIEAELPGRRDVLPADDRRALALVVEPSLPVLLVDGVPGRGYESKLGFLQAALDPDGDGGGAFKVSRVIAAQLTPAALKAPRVVVLADLSSLEPPLTDALERYVVGGGGLLVGLGPDSDPGFLNRHWARDGEGLLPCPVLGAVAPARAAIPGEAKAGHPLFAGFGARADEAWRDARVRRYFQLDWRRPNLAGLDQPLRLDNGDPLVVERRRGLGLAALWTSSLNGDWNDLPGRAAYVPLVRALVGRLGSYVVPSRNIDPGGRIIETRVSGHEATARGPDGRIVRLEDGVWEGRGALASDPIDTPGVYTLRPGPGALELRYAVAINPSESALAPMAERDVAETLEGTATLLRRPEAVGPALEPGRREGAELWRWMAGAAIALMFVEAWAVRREAPLGRTAPATS